MIKEYKSFIFTGDKNSCSGCGACSQICKHYAIAMQPDEEGFLFPTVNKDKCVNCGLCDSICPAVGNNQANHEQEQHCYIATTKHKEYYKESASIGICTMLSEYVVSQGGIVYGCYLDEKKWSAYHIGVTDSNGVQQIRNSKYLQSNTKQTFTEVKTNLIDGKIVLFIGTPCQIAGLKAYLRKEYEKLYTVDLICHGVFCPELMPYEVKYWEKKYKGHIKHFRFRSKRVYTHANPGMVNFDLIKSDGKLKHIERHATSSPTYRCFAYSGEKSYNMRLSCYNCQFKRTSRYADITVGDPWFIKTEIINDSRLDSSNIIRSLYAVNTQKGKLLFKSLDGLLYQKEYPVDLVFVQPALKLESREIPKKREDLFRRYRTEDYGELVENLLCCNLESSHRKFRKEYYVKEIKRIIKQIIKKI